MLSLSLLLMLGASSLVYAFTALPNRGSIIPLWFALVPWLTAMVGFLVSPLAQDAIRRKGFALAWVRCSWLMLVPSSFVLVGWYLYFNPITEWGREVSGVDTLLALAPMVFSFFGLLLWRKWILVAVKLDGRSPLPRGLLTTMGALIFAGHAMIGLWPLGVLVEGS